MAFKWRKWNRIIHRDFGYLFLGMTIIYALSGIALNHLNDWNPNYVITSEDFVVNSINSKPSKDEVKEILKGIDDELIYKNHYYPNDDYLKIFVKDGIVWLEMETGEGVVELNRRRLFFVKLTIYIITPLSTGPITLIYFLVPL